METIIDNLTPPDSHLKLVNLIQQGADIDDLLNVIAKEQSNPFHASLAGLLRQKELNITVELADTDSPYCGQYNKERNQYTGTVSINPACQEMGYPISQILLHECVHSVTYSAVRSGTKEAELYKNRLLELKAHTRKELFNKGINPEDHYGLSLESHIEELVTEVFTNPELRELLQNIPAKPVRGKKLTETIQTMYDQIIEVVNNIIGGKEQDHPVVKEIMEIGAGLMVIDEKIQITEMLDESKQFTYQTSFLKNLLREERNLNPTDNPFEAHLLNISYPNAKLFNDYMNKYNGNPRGIEFQYGKDNRYAFTVPDATEPGQFRVSYFDKQGFSSHQTFNSIEESFEEMIKSGYRTEARGKLSELSVKPEFEIGNRVSTLIGELNSGKISHKEFVELRNAIHDELLPKTEAVMGDPILYTSENVYIRLIEKQLIDAYNQQMLDKDPAHTPINDINDNSMQNWLTQGNHEEMWFDYQNLTNIEEIAYSYSKQFEAIATNNADNFDKYSKEYDDLEFKACEELKKYGVMTNTDEAFEDFALFLKSLPVQESFSDAQIVDNLTNIQYEPETHSLIINIRELSDNAFITGYNNNHLTKFDILHTIKNHIEDRKNDIHLQYSTLDNVITNIKIYDKNMPNDSQTIIIDQQFGVSVPDKEIYYGTIKECTNHLENIQKDCSLEDIKRVNLFKSPSGVIIKDNEFNEIKSKIISNKTNEAAMSDLNKIPQNEIMKKIVDAGFGKDKTDRVDKDLYVIKNDISEKIINDYKYKDFVEEKKFAGNSNTWYIIPHAYDNTVTIPETSQNQKEAIMSDQFITESEITELFRNSETNAKSMVIEAEKEVVECINNYDYYRGYAKGMEGLIDKVENKESLTVVINEVQMLTNQYNMYKSHGEETPSFPAKQENTQFLKGQIHGIVDGVKTLRDINIGKFIDETPGLAAKPIPDYPALTGEEKHEYKDFVTVMRKNFPNAKVEDLNKLCTIAHEMNQNTLKNANGTLSEDQHSMIMEKEVSQIKTIMGDSFKGAGVSLDYEANHPAIRLELPKGHTNDKTGTYSVPEIPMHKLTMPNINSIVQTQTQTTGRSR